MEKYRPKHLYRWEYESNYIGEDYSDHYVVYPTFRDADLVQQSNYETIKKVFDQKDIKYIIVRFNHWLVGWMEEILINENHLGSLRYADDLVGQLEDYPLLDDDDYYQKRYEQMEEIYKDMNGKNGLYSYFGLKSVRSMMKTLGIKTIREMRKPDVMNIIDQLIN